MDQFGRRLEPLLIKVIAADGVVAIAPLARAGRFFGLPIRRLFFIGSGPADYGGFLCQANEGEAAAAMAAALSEIKFDLLDLDQLSESTAAALKTFLEPRYNTLTLAQEPTLVAGLPGTADAYLSGLSKKFRTNTVYADRRLRRDFKYEQILYENEADLKGGMEAFFRLHQRRWLSKGLPGLFLGGRNRRFHQDLASRLAGTGRLVLSAALVDDKPAAAFYGFRFNGVYSYYLGGFDPALAKFSVATVLILDLIKEAIAGGATKFDFLRGQESYKRRWGASETALYRLLAFPSTGRGRLAALVAARHNALVQRVRAGLHR